LTKNRISWPSVRCIIVQLNTHPTRINLTVFIARAQLRLSNSVTFSQGPVGPLAHLVVPDLNGGFAQDVRSVVLRLVLVRPAPTGNSPVLLLQTSVSFVGSHAAGLDVGGESDRLHHFHQGCKKKNFLPT